MSPSSNTLLVFEFDVVVEAVDSVVLVVGVGVVAVVVCFPPPASSLKALPFAALAALAVLAAAEVEVAAEADAQMIAGTSAVTAHRQPRRTRN